MTFGTYVSSGKSSTAPTVSHCTSGRSKSAEPAAKPSAGSAKADTATAPAPCTVSVMKRRRVTVSPSKEPGMPRSAVYLDRSEERRVGKEDRSRTTTGYKSKIEYRREI